MANHVDNLRRIVFVKDPTVLPTGASHSDAVDALAKANKLVILLSHGNRYVFQSRWTLPTNVKCLEYELDMPSIQATVVRIRDILREHGVETYSRHLDQRDPMPIVLSGALLTTTQGTELAFLNGEHEYVETHKLLETPLIELEQSEWDLF